MSRTATFHARRLTQPRFGRSSFGSDDSAPMALNGSGLDAPGLARDQKVTSDGLVWEWNAWTVSGEEASDDIELFGVKRYDNAWAGSDSKIISDKASKDILRKKTIDAYADRQDAYSRAGAILTSLGKTETSANDPEALTLPAPGTPSAPPPAPAGAPAPAGTTPAPADPAAAGGAAGTEPPAKEDGKPIPWGYIAAGFGGVVVVGGIIYFATRK